MSIVYIIHHDADNDGLASAYIAQQAIGSNCVLIGYDYGKKLDQIKSITSGSRVFMLDISLPLWDMLTLAQRVDLTWIDHHKRTYEELFAPLHKICNIVYGEKAACRLTWEYFNPLETEPLWVKYIGQYDVFEGFGSIVWNTQILPFEYACRGYIHNVESVSLVEDYNVNMMIDSGFIILGYLQQQVNKASENASLMMYEGIKVLVSTIGGENGAMWYNTDIVKNNQPDLICFPYYDFENDSWKVSLRQGVSENKVDCAKLAASFEFEGKKGGGHFNAAGFRCKELPFKITEGNRVN